MVVTAQVHECVAAQLFQDMHRVLLSQQPLSRIDCILNQARSIRETHSVFNFSLLIQIFVTQ